MTRPWLFIATLAASATLFLGAGKAQAGGHHSRHMSTDGDGMRSCSDLHVTFGDLDVERSEETFTIARARNLSLEAAQNGGITVVGWDRSETEITVCKAAGGDDPQEAKEALGR